MNPDMTWYPPHGTTWPGGGTAYAWTRDRGGNYEHMVPNGYNPHQPYSQYQPFGVLDFSTRGGTYHPYQTPYYFDREGTFHATPENRVELQRRQQLAQGYGGARGSVYGRPDTFRPR
ncbi:hypothetical protein KC315_g2070 [Hortaea werneckii]|nr:hypothetical protein KC315_g2070 [Hortaea werneckii]KAI7351460.1 hypothetical protein KC354_g12462 [Hortaea werneckii]